MQIVVRELDQTRIKYEAMIRRVGEKHATTAFSRALTHEGRKTYTAVKRSLRQQTDIPAGLIAEATKFKSSSTSNLRTIIEGRGSELPLRLFKPRQFSYGVRAKVWGRAQSFKSAFIVASIGGNVFTRTTAKRLPIKKLFGPSIPKELVKDATRETFEQSGGAVIDRAMHELSRTLTV